MTYFDNNLNDQVSKDMLNLSWVLLYFNNHEWFLLYDFIFIKY